MADSMAPVAAHKRPTQQTLQSYSVPAPVGGLNTVVAASAMPATDAMIMYNMLASEFGLRARLGSREWVTGMTGAANNEVRTVLPFKGSAADGSGDKLFAATSSGIYDCTSSTDAPSLALAFSSTSGDAGYGVCHAMVTSAGHFLLYADEVNGYHVYSETTATWAKVASGTGASQVSGINPGNACFLTVWKSRVWFVEKNTGKCWYLAAGAIYGVATVLNVGRAAQARGGGALVGLWSWTIDGGSGIDDKLVALFAGGDVAIYEGSDPASAMTFGLVGVWNVGGFPAGRRVASSLGGDLLLITKTGVRPLSQLVAGGEGIGQYLTAKVQNLFQKLILDSATLPNWALHLHPEDNALMLTAPTYSGAATEQLVMSLANRSWGRYRDLPIFSAAPWCGKLYYGTTDGKLCINDGFVDGVTLAAPTVSTPVQWSLITSFQTLGSQRQKQVRLLRPTVLAENAAPVWETAALYKYNMTELAAVSGTVSGTHAWDGAVWDAAVWSGTYTATQELRGASGCGVEVAVAVRGTSISRTALVNIDVMFEQGGYI